MHIHEKIDVLMKITDIHNSMLGKHLSFDASYVSRIRSGKRRIPQNHPFLEPLSELAAQHITDSYQKKFLSDFMGLASEWPARTDDVQKLLLAWLSQEDDARLPVESMLSGIASIGPAALSSFDLSPAPVPEEPAQTRFFYGNEGKRQAVKLFLSELAALENPPQLLLYSNEDFSWMYEDPEFSRQWALLLFQYIKQGGHIKIAHTISRASGEMLVALQKWIPIYMTGAIEPYYYPKILDRVFRKTMFIAEGYSAILASSVGENTESALNCLIHDSEAVHALEREFWQFFDTCKPLMQVFNMARQDQLLTTLQRFNEEQENMILVRTTPSFYTMPDDVARSMTARLNSNWLTKRQEISSASFASMMEHHLQITEILNLPSEEAVLAGEIDFPMCDLLDRPGLRYTPEEFIAHLENMITLLKLYDDYQVLLSDAIPANELIYIKEDTGVILVKSDLPSIAFALNEQRMVAAFWDYLDALTEMGPRKEKVLVQLEKYLQKLRDGLAC